MLTALAFADALSAVPLLALTFLPRLRYGADGAVVAGAIQPELGGTGAVGAGLRAGGGEHEPRAGGLVRRSAVSWSRRPARAGCSASTRSSFLGIATVLLLWHRPRTTVPAAERERLLTALSTWAAATSWNAQASGASCCAPPCSSPARRPSGPCSR
ncbi:hypothetical protein ACRAWF_06175 [Streptomyces sp. L7]